MEAGNLCGEIDKIEVKPIASYHPDSGFQSLTKMKESVVDTNLEGAGSVNADLAVTHKEARELTQPTQENCETLQQELEVHQSLDGLSIPADRVLVHGSSGPYLMEKKQWPVLGENKGMNGDIIQEHTKILPVSDLVTESDIEGLTQEESLMDLGILTSGDERDTEENQQSWVVSGSKKKTKKQKKSKVMIATRVSSRVPMDGRTMMEKAMQRAQDKDVASKGNSSANQFLVLNELDNEHIQNVVSELDLEIDNLDTQIDTFKAEERVRAALAEANYKEYLEKIKKRTAPQGEEELSEYNLGIIDNSTREVELEKKNAKIEKIIPPKGRGRPRKKQP